ncbi:MAG TPA: hypothetical protein VHG72_21820 [Polyangia bacterium]|nr:hypothetical protein [Polyangia bacterium]
MTGTFQRRGHPELKYGYKPGRHLLGVPPRKDAVTALSTVPVPTTDCGLDEDAIRALGILDQGPTPYCVSHGWTGAVRDCEQRNGNAAPQLGSRLWLMYFMHAIENDISGFDGAIVADGAEALERVGLPPETALPFSETNPNASMVKPSADVIRQAYDQKAPIDYGQIMSVGTNRVDDVLRALSAAGKGGKPCPVVFGCNVTNAFASNNLPPGYLVGAPDPGDIDGGHCMRIVRAVCDPGVTGGVKFRVVNSWSDGWGDGGMFWMTPAYLMDPATDDLHFADYQGVTP